MKRIALPFLLLFSFATILVQAQTNSSGETEARMGFARAVEISDGSIFIGEPSNAHQPGLVYIYQQSETGWSQLTKLQASDGKIGDGFGSALNAAGMRVLIGAPDQDDGRGAVYLFDRSGDTWTETAHLAYPDTMEAEFGSSVALHGGLAIVGAPDERDGTGAVYVFKRSESGSWTQQARIANPDTSRGMSFGSALAVDNTRLVVGAPDYKGGAAYVYQQDDKGMWNRDTTLVSRRVDQRAEFGATLSLRDDRVLIGAPDHAARSGAVFAYRFDATSGDWMSDGRLVAYDSEPRYGFGSSLDFAGSDVWVGAPGADRGKGALYQFVRNDSGDGWARVQKIEGPERQEGDAFAGTFALEGDLAVAGLTGADYGAGTAAVMERKEQETAWSVLTTIIPKGGSVLEPITGGKVECRNGSAKLFGCDNVNLLSFLPLDEIGGDRGVRLNDIWGWTDPKTGKEYALVGRIDGTSFVDVSNPTNPVYVGTLPMTEGARANAWRDIKVYKNHAYIVADNAGRHGMQVFDLTNLRDYDGSPITFEESAHYDNIHSAHNVVINTDTGYAYIVGSSGGGQTCGGGLHMVNIQDPTTPTFAGCFSDPSTGRSGTGYTHDAQCVVYQGPDEQYQGQEICFGANETAVSIADVTDKENPKAISTASYPDHAYVHQGWLTEDHRYFFQNDELDELGGDVEQTRTLVWDVTDLDDPQLVREYLLDNPSTDHNLYIKDGTMYQSNYVSGLQVIDVSDPENPEKIGYFDTQPFGEDQPGFSGTWSNYPFFDSDIVIMTSSREGLFILKKAPQEPEL